MLRPEPGSSPSSRVRAKAGDEMSVVSVTPAATVPARSAFLLTTGSTVPARQPPQRTGAASRASPGGRANRPRARRTASRRRVILLLGPERAGHAVAAFDDEA